MVRPLVYSTPPALLKGLWHRPFTLLPMGAGIVLFCFGALAQDQQLNQTNIGGTSNSVPLTLTEIGLDHRVWKQVIPVSTNKQGQVRYLTNGGYTEISPGLYHYVGTNLVESSEDVQVTQNGGSATNGQTQVAFAANLNTSSAVSMATSDGKFLQSYIFGLDYYDPSTHSNILIAMPTNCIGQIINTNQVVYSNAFMGANIDALYTYRKSGLEQDMVIQSQLPDPSIFGLNPETTQLRVWTEFINPPTPQITQDSTGDQHLDFGAMKMGTGRAFLFGNENNAVPVSKMWYTSPVDGRIFLIEAVQFNQVASQLETLPAFGTNGRSAVNQFEGFPNRLPPRPKLAQQGAGGLKMAAAASKPDKGFVMDYVTVSSTYTNYTFQGDTTYYISGQVTLYGTTTIEGGSVLKFLDSSSFYYLDLEGPLACKTSPYHPAVLTSKNDNSVGAAISGSSGSPATGSYDFYVLANYGSATTVSNLRFCYGYTGLSPFFVSAQIDVWDCQFLNCNMAINDYSSSDLHLHNCLFAGGSYGVFFEESTINLTAEHLTSDTTNFWGYGFDKPNLFLTNSIIKGTFSTNANTAPTTNCVAFVSSSSAFQSVAGGNYYLATNSPYLDAGTTNLNTSVLADIKQKTTFPPVRITSNFSADTTLSPEAFRDTDTPDLGYHYDPLDYVWSNLTVNSSVTLTLNNGVAAGMWGATGLTINGALAGQGTPLMLDQFLGCCMVQEQPLTAMTTLVGGNGTWANFSLRFADLPTLGGAVTYLSERDSTTDISPGSVTLQDCQLLGGTLSISLASSSMTLTLMNNLIERGNFSVDRTFSTVISGPPSLVVNAYNNLFHFSTLELTYSISIDDGSDDFPVPNPVWTWDDNLFEGLNLSETLNDYGGLYASNYVTSGYNGYVNYTNTFADSSGTVDKFPSSADYQTGPLGRYYYPTSGGNLSTLINAGSTTADNLGLYHYTTQTNQLAETNSTVDIGFHWVALGTNGLPLDSNGDGIPDYLADSNGNGVYNAGVDLAAWATNTTQLDTNGTVKLTVYTPLK